MNSMNQKKSCCSDQTLFFPRKVFSLLIVELHLSSSVLADQLARVTIEQDQRWNATNLKLFRHLVFRLAIGVVQRQPWHVLVVIIECGFITIRADEDNFKVFRSVMLVVEFSQNWGEAAAWRAPMRAEVHADDFALVFSIVKVDLGVGFVANVSVEERSGTGH